MTAPKDLQEAKDKGLNRLEDTDLYNDLLKWERKSHHKPKQEDLKKQILMFCGNYMKLL